MFEIIFNVSSKKSAFDVSYLLLLPDFLELETA
jgi:hypothetical protein